MGRNEQEFIKIVLAIFDIFVTIVSFFIAYWFRDFFFEHSYGNLQGMETYTWLLIIIIPLWVILLVAFKVYDIKLNRNIRGTLKVVFRLIPAVIIGDLVLTSVFYLTGRMEISRLFFIMFAIINFVLLWFDKMIVQLIWHSRVKDKKNHQQVLVVGTGDRDNFTKYVNKNPQLMMNIIGYVSVGDIPFPENKKVLGTIDDLVDILKKNVVDEVVFNIPTEYMPEIEDFVFECENMGISVRMVIQLSKMTVSKTEVEMLGNIPMISFHTVNFSPFQSFLKRSLDICGAVIGLIITAIAFIFIAPAIKLDSEGPILFGQYRIGRNGRKFKFYKFRSMYKDAEERKKALMSKNEMQGYMFKMTDDPRITKVGNFLRKTSLDELPQFWNILKGDMSLVGTRPPTMDEVVKYDTHHWKRLSIKPGLTGMWQVSGRSDITDFDEVVRLDVEYIDKWSIWLDIRIIFQTVLVVFKREGSK